MPNAGPPSTFCSAARRMVGRSAARRMVSRSATGRTVGRRAVRRTMNRIAAELAELRERAQPARPVDVLDDAWRPTTWLDPPRHPETRPPVAEAALVAGIAAAHVVDHRLVPPRVHLATHLLAAAAAVGAALGAGATPTDLGLRPDRMLVGLRRGLAVSGVIGAVVGLGAAWPRTRHLFVDARVLDVSPGEVAFHSLVRIPLATAVYEELVFRGVILGLALRRLPPLPAVAATSALFGLWHVLPALADREHHPRTRDTHPAGVVTSAVLSTTIAGFVFGWERLRTNSVVAPILTHATTNGVTFAVAAIVSRSHPAREDLLGRSRDEDTGTEAATP